MNRFCLHQFLFSALLLAVAPAFGQNSTSPTSTSQPSPDEQTILQLERDLVNAYNTGDTKILERILADDMVNTGMTKPIMLSYKKPYDADKFDITDAKANVWESTAVATGIMIVTPKEGGAETIYYRYTDTFVRRQNKWQLVASQRIRTPVWRVRPMEDNELTNLNSQDCTQESSLRTLNSENQAFIKLTNATKQPITSYWIDREGKRSSLPMQKVTVQPGASFPMYTFLTHPFVVTDASGKCLGIYQASKEPGLVVIK